MKGTGRLSAGRAVKRLKRLSDGGMIALNGRFRGTSPSVPLLGPGQLVPWLTSLDGDVLYIHDDVAIDADDVETLVEARSSSTLLTAPARGPSEASAHDTPAVVGSPDQVAAFIADTGTDDDARSQLQRVPDLSLDHEMSCRDALGRPLLIASMIVRDEADQIGACLESLEGVVDRVEIVDTGSIDDTIEIARAHGAVVTSSTWTDDFGAARNVALDRCRDGRFVLHIDADERLVAADIDGFRRSLAATSNRALRVSMRNLVAGRVTSEFEAVRVFATDRTTWVGRVHEYPADSDGRPLAAAPVAGVRIDHLGYDPEIVAAKDKWNRNVELAEAAYRTAPSFKTRLDLARSLAWRSDDERAFALFREAADDLTGASPGAAAFVIAHVGLSHQIDGELDQAHERADEALSHCNGEYVAHLANARAWRAAGNDDAIVQAHLRRVSSDLDPPMFDTAATRTMTDALTVGALARLGRHVDALELAVTVLDADPSRFDEWKSLAEMPQALRETGLPLLASMDPTAGFVDPLVGSIPMPELAGLAMAHVEAQPPNAHAVITGIMAALIAGESDTAVRIAELGVHALDDAQRAATAERCRLRGATTVAHLLDPALV